MLGLIGTKLGMTRVFGEDGWPIAVTVIDAGPCSIVQIKSKETDGYQALQLGFGEIKESRINKTDQGHLAKAKSKPIRILREFRVDDIGSYEVNQEVTVDIFEAGKRVDVMGMTKGKGFQGVIKRHNYGGGPASHGSMFHRAPG